MVVKVSELCNRKILLAKNKGDFLRKTAENHAKYDYAILFDEKNRSSINIHFLYKDHQSDYKVKAEYRFIREDEKVDIEKTYGRLQIVKNKKDEIIGVIGPKEYLNYLVDKIHFLEKRLDHAETDLNAFMSGTDDLVCISNGSGSKVRLSASSEKLYGIESKYLIGQNVKDLEKKGMYDPSATRIVIEEKKRFPLHRKQKQATLYWLQLFLFLMMRETLKGLSAYQKISRM